MNSNYPRWIYASASKHFQAAANVFGIHFYLEGTVPKSIAEHEDYTEFRMDGPFFREVSNGLFYLDVEINILWSVSMNSTDFHKSQKIAGMLSEAMTDICCYKFGDDSSYLGELTIKDVRVNHFGQVNAKTNLVQGAVEGSYQICLNKE